MRRGGSRGEIAFLDTVPIFEKSPESEHGSRAKGREVSGERIAVSVHGRSILYGFGFPSRDGYSPSLGVVSG